MQPLRSPRPPLSLVNALAAVVLIGGCADEVGPVAPPADASAPSDGGPDTTAAEVFEPAVLGVSDITPAEGPTGGLVQTELRGSRLSTVTAVRFGATPALDVFPVSDTLLVLLTPPHPAGLVDVTLETTDPDAPTLTLEAAYRFRDPVQVSAVSPAVDHPMGGARVTVYGAGFTPGARVLFGQRLALSVDVVDAETITCTVPAGAPGVTDVIVASDEGTAVLRRGFAWVGEPLPPSGARIDAVRPASGPSTGGTEIMIEGSGFLGGSVVRVGAMSATRAEASADGRTLTLRTPPGSPGPSDVHVVLNGRAASSAGAFTYTSEERALFAAVPTRGAIAGGSRVRLIGIGLPSSGRPRVSIGGRGAMDVGLGDGTWIDFTTPPGTPGDADVMLEHEGETLTLRRGFTYFDPGSRPGAWGGPLDGHLNVTVIDAGAGTRLRGAFVMLGPNTGTAVHRGFTDDNGQLILGAGGLFGGQFLTASKSGYQSFHLAGFDAENVTIALERAPTCADVEDMPCDSLSPPPMSATFDGRIVGSTKGPSLPFGRCRDWADAVDGLCAPCTSASTCGSDAPATCLPLGDEGSFCTRRCEADAECSAGFVCLDPTGQDLERRCVPPPGTPAVFCDITEPSIFATDSLQFPGRQVGEDGRVRFETRLGQFAVFCWGGVLVRGAFRPERLGVARGLTAEQDRAIVRADIRLDIPLSKDVTMVLDRPTLGRGSGFLDGDRALLRTFLDLSGDGVLEFPPLRAFSLRSFRQSVPANLTGTLRDATWTLVGGVESPSIDGGSLRIDRNLRELAAAFDYRILPGGVEAVESRLAPVHAATVWRAPDGTDVVLAATDDGAIARRVGQSWGRMNGASVGRLLAVGAAPGPGPDGVTRAIAGGEGGGALHWDGFRWLPEPIGDRVMTGVAFDTAETAWATAGDAVLRWDGAVWTEHHAEPGRSLHGIAVSPAGRVVVVGDGGLVLAGDEAGFAQLGAPTAENLRAAAFSPDGSLDIVGDEGTWLHAAAGESLGPIDTPSSRDLFAVAFDGAGVAHAGGVDGTLWRRLGETVDVMDPGVSRGSIRAIAREGGGLLALGSHERVVGPLMGIPENVSPGPGGSIAGGISWTARDGLDAHFSLIDFESAVGPCSACGLLFMLPFTEWRSVIEGRLNRADFPLLDGIPGALPMARGFKSIAIYRVRVDEGFDFDDTAETGFFGDGWRAWAWRFTTAMR